MSSISKMQIRGIRSFSPERDETIEFYSPLTMIVGANGCGKTTIIESLKFLCAGSLPPNNKNGQSLINDPSMTDATEVKAHVKLRFQNRGDHTCVAIRSLQVQKKKTKLEYKALEGVLRTTNEKGEKVSISMKCSDMDRIIPENLGVSPAIIENVIFVHQEDSNWPMQEGIVLKKRFDDVFESTRYTKALEALNKSKKEYQLKSKDLKGDLMELNAHFHAAKGFIQKLKESEESKGYCEDQLKDVNDSIQKTKEKLDKVNEKLADLHAKVDDFKKVQWQLKETEKRYEEKSLSISEKLTDSDDKLIETLENYDTVLSHKEDECLSLEKKLDELSINLNQLRDQMNQLNTKKGQSVALKENIKSLKNELNDQLDKLKGEIHFSRISFSKDNYIDNKKKLENEIKALKSQIDNDLGEEHKKVDDSQGLVTREQNKLEKLDLELKLKSDEAHLQTQEMDQFRLEFARLSSSRLAIEQNQRDFDEAMEEYDAFMNQYASSLNEIKIGIKDNSDSIRKLQEKIAEESCILQDLSLQRSEISKLDASLKQADRELMEVKAEAHSEFQVHRDLLQDYAEPQESKDVEEFNHYLNRKCNRYKVDIKDSNDKLSQANITLAKLQSQLEHQNGIQSKLSHKLTEFNQKKEQLRVYVEEFNLLKNSPILENSEAIEVLDPSTTDCGILLEAVKQTENEARELLVIAKSGRVFLKRFKKAKSKTNQCPCCSQQITPEIETVYENNMKSLFSLGEGFSMPSMEEYTSLLQQCTSFASKVQDLYNEILPFVSLNEELDDAKKQIAILTDESNRIESEKLQIEELLNSSEHGYNEFENTYRIFNELLARWKNIEGRKSDFEEKKKRQSQSLFIPELGNRSIEDIEASHRNNIDLKDELQLKKDKLVQEESNLNKKFFTIKSQLAEKEKELNESKFAGHKYSELESTIQKSQKKIESIEERKSNLSQERSTLLRSLSEKKRTLESLKMELLQKEKKLSQTYEKSKAGVESYINLLKSLETNESKFSQENLVSVENEIDALADKIHQVEYEMDSIKKNQIKVQSEIRSQEHTKRNVLDNIEIRKYLNEIEILRQKMNSIEGVSSSFQMELDESVSLQKISMREQQNLYSERDVLIGKIEIYQQQINELNHNINSNPTYKDIEEKTRKKTIDFETTNLAVADIDNYYNALDRALQNFHNLKIKEINKIIRELWQMIYKGQDIDMIEIESGQDDSNSSARGSRSYNYRVVMKKGNVPLDMRGRCSAGQKVLAAIVIRLALAETFCLSCGILALDEPTTNLDEANKAGLAHALARIIMSRSRQQNFQLICITHDEDFVKLMSNELSSNSDFSVPEYYFRIYRQEEGNSGKFFSHIERIPWDEI